MSKRKDKSIGISERSRQNEMKPCAQRQCGRYRRGLSKYCVTHEGRSQRYGHPEGRHVQLKEYQAETCEVRDFIERHLEHDAIVAGIRFFDEWLSAAGLGKRVPGRSEFRNLYDHGVTGRRCLEAALSLWLFSYRRPHILPTRLQLEIALALAVLKLAPREKKAVWTNGELREYGKNVGHKVRKAIGEKIRTTLFMLVHNVKEAIHKELERDDDLKKTLAKGFNQEAMK